MSECFDQISRVRSCLEGRCQADSRTLDAVAVLAERLQHLKESSPLFSRVHFSAAVQRFAQDAAPILS